MEFFEKFLSHTENSRALEAALYTLRNAGKRIRPNLVFKTAALFDVYDENVERIACAVELIHNYSLIHDDLPCMDDDDFRRGKPSCHKVFGLPCLQATGCSILPQKCFAADFAEKNISKPWADCFPVRVLTV